MYGEILETSERMCSLTICMHNFMQPNVAQKSELRVNHDRKFAVFIGNENSFLCECVCLNTIMESQSVKYKVDIFVLSLQGPNLVLGMP